MTELSGFIGKKLALRQLSEGCSVVSSTRLNADTRLFFIPRWFIELVAILLGRKPACKLLYGSLQVDISKAHEQHEWLLPIYISDGLKKTAIYWLEGR